MTRITDGQLPKTPSQLACYDLVREPDGTIRLTATGETIEFDPSVVIGEERARFETYKPHFTELVAVRGTDMRVYVDAEGKPPEAILDGTPYLVSLVRHMINDTSGEEFYAAGLARV